MTTKSADCESVSNWDTRAGPIPDREWRPFQNKGPRKRTYERRKRKHKHKPAKKPRSFTNPSPYPYPVGRWRLCQPALVQYVLPVPGHFHLFLRKSGIRPRHINIPTMTNMLWQHLITSNTSVGSQRRCATECWIKFTDCYLSLYQHMSHLHFRLFTSNSN